jgi:hypothetical protein
MKSLLSIGLMSLLILSCQKKEYKKFTNDPALYCRTVKALNNVVLENNFPPMIASRNYAYANIAAYEVMVLSDARFQSLAGQIKHLPKLSSIDTAGADIGFAALLAFCKVGEAVTFPEGSLQDYTLLLDSLATAANMTDDMKLSSRRVADSVANHILRWSKKDNYLETRTATKFTITDEEGRYVPTPPMYAQALEPHWREIRSMTMDSASQFMPVRPPVIDVNNKNSYYYKSLMEVKTIGDSLSEEQKHIADFWDDNPFKMNVTGHVMFATKKFSPAGHWMNIVGIASQKAGADFATTIAAYAKTSIALFDAFISCWDEKYRSVYVRPETNINKYVDANWRPYIQTPPFPSYTSGHGTISAAAAESMTEFFGDQLTFTDTSLLEFGIKNRTIVSFREAAKEAAMSRLYGGIHYRFDNDNGNSSGRKLGEFIVGRIRMKKN